MDDIPPYPEYIPVRKNEIGLPRQFVTQNRLQALIAINDAVANYVKTVPITDELQIVIDLQRALRAIP